MSDWGVLLLLDAPLQSWGTQGRFGHRDTDSEPSKSGVIGLIGAALGLERGDDLAIAPLAAMNMAVRVDREGKVLRDYHTAGGGTYRGEPHGVFGSKDTIVTTRYYLADACFVVALSSEDQALVARVVEALGNPRWPLFLGRKSCVPTRQLLLGGPLAGSAANLIRLVPDQLQESNTTQPPEERTLRCLIEDAEGAPRGDVPRSFAMYARRFDTRFVREDWISSTALPKAPHVFD